MADVVSYKGLTVVENASGDGGAALTANLKLLADRIDADSADLIVHLADISNPHSVTAAQVGNSTAQWNADQLQGNVVSSSTPDENDHMVWSAANGWQPELMDISHDASPTLGGNLELVSYTVGGADSAELGFLAGVTSDVQTQLNVSSLTSGTRPFTGTVGGVTPSTTAHLATKGYVDSLVSGLDWQESVLDQLNIPPGGEGAGDRYLCDTTASGAWSGQSNNLAEYNGSGWDFVTADTGMAVWIEDIDKQKTYNGATWVLFGSTVDHGSLIGLGDDDHTQYMKNLSEDITPQLGGNLDIVSYAIEGVNATRFGYLTTLTSNVQTQLNGKSPTSHSHTESDVSDLGNYLENISEDTTPTFGGDLDLLTYKIFTSTVNQDIIVEPSGTGAFQLDSDGNARGTNAVDLQMSRVADTGVVSGNYSFIGGGHDNRATTAYATICGGTANAIHTNNYSAIVGGRNNIISDFASIICGGLNHTIGAAYSFVGGGNNNDIVDSSSATYSAIVGGSGNRVGSDSTTTGSVTGGFIGGGTSNKIYNDYNASTNTFSTIAGGANNRISGVCRYSFIGGGGSNVIDNGIHQATYATISGGRNNLIGGEDSASSNAYYGAIGGGYENWIDGNYSTIPGGFRAKAELYGEYAYASGSFSVAGDAQTMTFIVRNQTTDSTETELFMNGSSSRMILNDQDAWAFSVLIVGRQTNADNVSAGYKLEGVIDNNGGTTALVGSILKTTLGEDETSWDVEATANDAVDALKISVIGTDGDNVNWVARVDVAKTNG